MTVTRRQLPLHALRAFEAAARYCHLRTAAEELGVTHGAVSRQIRQLEAQIGVQLFDRSHNRLSLTSAGQRLFTTVAEAMDQIIESTLYLDPESMTGRLVVASTPSISATWLIGVVGEFSVKYPEVELRLVHIQPGQKSLPADFDVAICYGRPDERHKDVRELYRERYQPVCSHRLLKPEQPIQTPSDLLQYRLLHDHHNHWPRWLETWRINGRETVRGLYLQDAFQVINAIREGYGIGLVDRLEVARELRIGTLISLFDQSIEAAQPHYLVAEREDRLTVRARLFVDHLNKVLSEMAVRIPEARFAF